MCVGVGGGGGEGAGLQEAESLFSRTSWGSSGTPVILGKKIDTGELVCKQNLYIHFYNRLIVLVSASYIEVYADFFC